MAAKVVLPRLRWQPSPNQSERRAPVTLVVAHRWGIKPEPAQPGANVAYQGVCDYLCQPSAQASAHIVYGGSLVGEATQLVPWGRKAWAQAHYNSVADSIEYSDAIWSYGYEEGFRVAARIAAFRLHKRGLPAVWVHGDALLAGAHGITRHYDLGALGGGHTDPTLSTELWLEFMALVKSELKRGRFRRNWGR